MTSEELTRSLMDLRHAATDRATFVVVGPRRFFAIDGIGSPASAEFRFALEPLRDVTRRARSRVLARLTEAERLDVQPAIPECLWWHRDLAAPDDLLAAVEDRSDWHWRQMMELPHRATEAEAEEAIRDAASTAGRASPLVRVAAMHEGRVAQILHRGRSATIGDPLRRLYAAIAADGATPGRTIHELRVADERLVPADRAHLIVRVALEPAASRA
jgi:hypothetical protein